MQVVIGSVRTSGKMESQAQGAMSKPLPKGIVHDWADSFSHAVTQEHEAALITVAFWLLSMTEKHWLYMQKAD